MTSAHTRLWVAVSIDITSAAVVKLVRVPRTIVEDTFRMVAAPLEMNSTANVSRIGRVNAKLDRFVLVASWKVPVITNVTSLIPTAKNKGWANKLLRYLEQY